MLQSNIQLELAKEFMMNTAANLFLTGKAGTGKTTFLHTLSEVINKRLVVAAPTGVAAINARGVTLHSLFQIPFGVAGEQSAFGSRKHFARMSKIKRALIRSIELLVIDEISMVRCDLLDSVDEVLRRVRNDNRPFGGVQLLMIGDIHQLSPICKDDEWNILRERYNSPYFFDSKALQQTSYKTIELKTIYRQSDTHFTEILNSVRDNKISEELLDRLNSRYIPNFTPKDDDGYITLVTHNNRANSINNSKLSALKSDSYYFDATIDGDYPDWSFPNDESLELKLGAQVIFIKNDPSPAKLYYNGMIGRVVEIGDDFIVVQPNESGDSVTVSAVKWENIEYILNPENGEIESNVKGYFMQIPLKCAWAITIHKSQGLSFDKAIIDAGRSFAHGQVYVALSRCRTFEGMVLSTPISLNSVIKDYTVDEFSQYVKENEPTNEDLAISKRDYFEMLLCEVFDFRNIRKSTNTIYDIFLINFRLDYPSLLDALTSASSGGVEELIKVGEQFKNQLKMAISSSENYICDAYIAERLQKAEVFFKDRLKLFVDIASELSGLEIDSKELRNDLNPHIELLVEDVEIKMAALSLCGNKFSCEDYLKLKYDIIAMKGVSNDSKKKSKSSRQSFITQKVSSDISHPELYEILRLWRKSVADELNKPAFTVMGNLTLLSLQAALPITIDELFEVRGIGKVTVDKYGDQLLEIIEEYVVSNNIGDVNRSVVYVSEQVEDEVKEMRKSKNKREKVEKVASHLVTLKLLNEGKSVSEIAEYRGVTVHTIYNHIAKNIEAGSLNVLDYVDEDKVARIKNALESNPDSPRSALFAQLGDDVTYQEINLVISSNK